MRSDSFAARSDDTGPIGPVAVSALLLLIVIAPLMRGGNRQVAMIALEGVALAFLVAASARAGIGAAGRRLPAILLAILVLSPLWLAAIYLLPLPAGLWDATRGRGIYPDLLSHTGIAQRSWLPLSLVPDATRASLFAGIPVLAGLLAGLWASLRQLKAILWVVAGMALLEVVFALLQAAGGGGSTLYFGGTSGNPMGTFANANHFANYLAMGLASYTWLAWSSLTSSRRSRHHYASMDPRRVAAWAAGALFLLVGILMSRSRGGALCGLTSSLAAFVVALGAGSRERKLPWRTILLVTAGTLLLAAGLVGFQFVVSRFNAHQFASDASFRALLSETTLKGAAQFAPWGAGWGTYGEVYPRFQPATINGVADYAHDDYAQMLFEGGIFAVLLMAAFAYLAFARASTLVRSGLRHGRLRRDEMASALCGLGLLGFLLHCLVEFNMHIPANAITAALLAGVFLRPLDREPEASGD